MKGIWLCKVHYIVAGARIGVHFSWGKMKNGVRVQVNGQLSGLETLGESVDKRGIWRLKIMGKGIFLQCKNYPLSLKFSWPHGFSVTAHLGLDESILTSVDVVLIYLVSLFKKTRQRVEGIIRIWTLRTGDKSVKTFWNHRIVSVCAESLYPHLWRLWMIRVVSPTVAHWSHQFTNESTEIIVFMWCVSVCYSWESCVCYTIDIERKRLLKAKVFRLVYGLWNLALFYRNQLYNFQQIVVNSQRNFPHNANILCWFNGSMRSKRLHHVSIIFVLLSVIDSVLIFFYHT